MKMNQSFFFAIVLCTTIFLCQPQNSHARETHEWVTESNKHSKILLDVLAQFAPETGSSLGIESSDHEIVDYSPGFNERALVKLEKAQIYFQNELKQSSDGPVKQDLQILHSATNDYIEGLRLDEQYLMPYLNVSETVFRGLRSLLDKRQSKERQQAALVRLKKYAGTTPGYSPITEMAKAYLQKEWQNFNRQAPFKEEIERHLTTSTQLMEGIGSLFQQFEIKDYEKDYNQLVKHIEDYNKFIREEILPKARTDFKLPREIYAYRLKEFGIDMPIEDLQKRALVTFSELQSQMQVLAVHIAQKHGYPSSDYRDVIRSMKKNLLDSATILPFYNKQITEIEKIIEAEKIVTLPERDAIIRLATKAESARTPSPFMSPPRLIGNTGEYGEFVLPTKVLGGTIDDFMHEAAAWPLTAHEARPGHELQFSSIVEKGVSQARAIFAQNSVNIEGWAMYSEQIMLPYAPLEGQFMTLWSRLVRAGRAFLDPGLNLGKLSVEEARHILQNDIVLSEALLNSELERYRFRAPGQATSYFNGYLRMMEIRTETELLLGNNFDQLKFHDYILSLGLLPPVLIHEAVMNNFVPLQKN